MYELLALSREFTASSQSFPVITGSGYLADGKCRQRLNPPYFRGVDRHGMCHVVENLVLWAPF
jgi:hypothetical protein